MGNVKQNRKKKTKPNRKCTRKCKCREIYIIDHCKHLINIYIGTLNPSCLQIEIFIDIDSSVK